jgi:ATP-dependent DNA helicase RecG
MNIQQLIAQPEGSTLDFKRDLSSLEKVVKTVAAIANTANGMVIVGVSDDRSVFGLKDPLRDEERLARAIACTIEPLLLVDIKHSTAEGKAVIIVDVPFAPRPYYLTSAGPVDGVFVREGSTNTRADPATIEELRRQGASRSFDLESVPGVLVGDLDGDRLRGAFGRKLPTSKLETLGLAIDHAGRTVATNAGIILFGTDQQRLARARDAHVRCAAFRGTNKSVFLDKAEEFQSTTVLEALDLFASFIAKNTRSGASFGTGIRRRNIDEYHPDALRELIVNAIAHANYASTGSPISVQLFADRIEIISPGRFPPGTTVQSLKDGMSKIRNHAIAETLHHLNIMETWGSGWDRIRTTFSEGYPEPSWHETGGAVKVVLPVHPHFAGTPVAAGAGKRTRKDRKPQILELLSHGPLRTEEIASELEISKRRAQQILNELLQSHQVEVDGARTSPDRTWLLPVSRSATK